MASTVMDGDQTLMGSPQSGPKIGLGGKHTGLADA
jgi:hypothetical protein